jgi:hypothetical protein
MKKMIFTSICVFIISISNCFSQLSENNKKEYKSITRFVYGYSDDFNELDLGITFGKVINLVDPDQFIRFNSNWTLLSICS